MNIAGYRLFKSIGIKKDGIDKRSSLKLSFANKGLDGINLGNILHYKPVKYKIPPYSKDHSIPLISYAYISYQIYLTTNLNIDDFKYKPPDCICASSPFIYNPSGHVIAGDLKIINNTSLRDVFAKGPKYRESKSINWKHNFTILMDSVEDYARRWAKCEKGDLDNHSKWVKSMRSLIQIRIKTISEHSLYINL